MWGKEATNFRGVVRWLVVECVRRGEGKREKRTKYCVPAWSIVCTPDCMFGFSRT